MKYARVLVVALVLIFGLSFDAQAIPKRSPGRQPLTVFGCSPGGTLFTYSLWATLIIPCAEHLGDGHYRSWVQADTWRQDTGQSIPANYGFYTQKLFYYCNNTCIQYDNVTNLGYIQVIRPVSTGNSIGCPGASNTGKVTIARVDVRYPDTVLKSYTSIVPTPGIQFNSHC